MRTVKAQLCHEAFTVNTFVFIKNLHEKYVNWIFKRLPLSEGYQPCANPPALTYAAHSLLICHY